MNVYTAQLDNLLNFTLYTLHHVQLDVFQHALSYIENQQTHNSELFVTWHIADQLNYILSRRDHALVKKFVSQNKGIEKTSYDHMVCGTREKSQFHPHTAIRHYKKSMELNPFNFEVLIYFCNVVQELHHDITSAKMAIRGVRCIDNLLASIPPVSELCQFNAQVLVPVYNQVLSLRHLLLGRIISVRDGKEGIPRLEGLNRNEHFRHALRYDPQCIHAHFYLSYLDNNPEYTTQTETEMFEQAIGHFLRALECINVLNAPIYHSLIYNNIASTYNRLKDKENTLKYVQEALRINPRSGWAHYTRSRLHDADNNDPDAIQKRQIGIENLTFCIEELAPELPSVMSDMLCERGYLKYQNDRQVTDFLSCLNKCLELDPTNYYAHCYRMMILYSNKDIEEKYKTMTNVEVVGVLFDEAVALCRDEELISILERKADFYQGPLSYLHEKAIESVEQFMQYSNARLRID